MFCDELEDCSVSLPYVYVEMCADFSPRFHQMMYTPEGQKTTERLWEETLDELNFAGVKEIINSMSQRYA
jgi:hypothetical protein